MSPTGPVAPGQCCTKGGGVKYKPKHAGRIDDMMRYSPPGRHRREKS